MKNNKINWPFSIIVVSVCIIVAVLINSNLGNIYKITHKYPTRYVDMEEFWSELGDVIAASYDSIMKRNVEDYQGGIDLIYTDKVPKGAEEETLKVMNEYLEGVRRDLEVNYPNLLFVVQNQKTGAHYSNDTNLEKLSNQSISEKDIGEYQYFLQLSIDGSDNWETLVEKGVTAFDESFLLNLSTFTEINGSYVYKDHNGERTLITQDEIDKYYNHQEEYYIEDGIIYNQDGNKVEKSELEAKAIQEKDLPKYDSGINDSRNFTLNYVYKAPRNIKVTFALKNKLEFQDSISTNLEKYKYNGIRYTSIDVMMILIGLFIFIALICAYDYEKNVIFIRKMIRLPLEMLGVLFGLIACGAALYASEIFPEIFQGNLADAFNLSELSPGVIQFINSSILLIGTSSILFFAFAGGVYLKHIFKNGFFRYLREHSLIIRGFRATGRGFKGLFRPIARMNLHEEDQRRLFVLCLTNIIISFIICCTWFFGIFLVVPYNVIIFSMIYRKWRKVKAQYDVLLEGTEKIASGTLDETITEDVGLFNPLRDDLAKIQEGFKVAVMEEVKSQNMKTELISNVSHDLKTPLTAIITYVDLLKNKELSSEEQQKYIAILDNKSQRLKALIEDLFEMSKASTGNITFEPSELDIIMLVKEVLVDLESKFTAADLQVRYQLNEEKVMVCLDGQKTYRIFENLFVNITKYAMSHSRVYVNEEIKDENVVITIKNIAAEELNYNGSELLERFVRGDQSRNTEGSGLGLAIAKSLCEGQGGSLGVEVDGDLFKVQITFPVLNKNGDERPSSEEIEKVSDKVLESKQPIVEESDKENESLTSQEDEGYKIEFPDEEYRIEDLIEDAFKNKQ